MLQTLVSYMDNVGFDAENHTLCFVIERPSPKNLSKVREEQEEACATFRKNTLRGFFSVYAENIFGEYHGNMPLQTRVELLVGSAPLIATLIVPPELGGTLSPDNMAVMLDEDYERLQKNLKNTLPAGRRTFKAGEQITIQIPKPTLLSYVDGSDGLPIMNDTNRLHFLDMPLHKYDSHKLRDMGFSSLAKLIERKKAADKLVAITAEELSSQTKPIRRTNRQHNKRPRREMRPL